MVRLDDVKAARERIHGRVVLTPCTPSEAFGEMFGGRAWFKFENLQRTGSFKERGALNCMLTLSDDERARGVIAASAGNHAQGVAFHATRLGIPATIVMPERTPLIKVSNVAFSTCSARCIRQLGNHRSPGSTWPANSSTV